MQLFPFPKPASFLRLAPPLTQPLNDWLVYSNFFCLLILFCYCEEPQAGLEMQHTTLLNQSINQCRSIAPCASELRFKRVGTSKVIRVKTSAIMGCKQEGWIARNAEMHSGETTIYCRHPNEKGAKVNAQLLCSNQACLNVNITWEAPEGISWLNCDTVSQSHQAPMMRMPESCCK